MTTDIRATFDGLSSDQRMRVVGILGADMELGWVPKTPDIAAAIAIVDGSAERVELVL